jgi:surface protein
MFYNCVKLTSLNLSNFNTNNVKEMNLIFSGLNSNYKIITNNEKIWVNLNINFFILNISLFIYFLFNL